DRVDEAIGTAPTKIATGCPFCKVMLGDGLTSRQNDGHASENVEILDVAQLLLNSVKRSDPDPAAVAAGAPSLDGGTEGGEGSATSSTPHTEPES
ncbi:MAG: Fe-S oxidoreductase, partial [Actinophytocola sp.]|nr:Fe-S oxidoreductase [Actinophytocola sp.]